MVRFTMRRSASLLVAVVGAGLIAVSMNLVGSLALAGSPKHQTFEWMNWVPPANSTLTEVLDTHFPHALPGGAVTPTISRVLTPLGIAPGNTNFGQSVCSDEINNRKGDIANEMIHYWGNVFPLGGIGGAPFVGKTGFGAFAGHVPNDGHIFILFGPHVGISPDGQVGFYHRKGQSKASGACGALIGGYKMLSAGTRIPADSMDDIQEAWLCTKIAPHVDEIAKSENPMVELVKVAYQFIEKEILTITHTKFGTGNLVLLGGIQINMPSPYQDHFLPLHFSIRSEGKPPVSMLRSFQ